MDNLKINISNHTLNLKQTLKEINSADEVIINSEEVTMKQSTNPTPTSSLVDNENITSQSLKEAEEKALKNISFEELDKKGLIPFANGHTLGAGFFGGSEALYNQRDYNNDGKTDIEDIAISALGGIIGFKALAKMFPSWFKEDIVANSINSNRLNKEKKNISKVAFGEKPSTVIRTYDKDSLNDFVKLSQGSYNRRSKSGGDGFRKIAVKHMQDGKQGYISLDELSNIGKILRDKNTKFELQADGKRKYILDDKDIKYTIIVNEQKGNNKIINFFSNREIGARHDAQHYTFSTNLSNGIIITYKPKTTFKEWINNLQKEIEEVHSTSKEISKQANTNKKTRRYKNK